MGFLSDAFGGFFGSKSSSPIAFNTTSTETSLEPITNVNTTVDLEPLADMLAKSQKQNADSNLLAQKLNADSNLLAQKLNVLNGEKNRKLEVQKLKKFDEYFKDSKNLLFLGGITAALLYASKKGKK